MENEIWKTIEDYPKYKISNFGRVKSFCKSPEIILKSAVNGSGYLHVRLKNDLGYKTVRVHKLVAVYFLYHVPKKDNLVVNHKNFIRTDNRVENLELISQRENSNQKHLKSSSKYVGVSYIKKTKKWRASIKINSKTICLGFYDLEEDASKKYKYALNCINNNLEIIPDTKIKTSKYKGVHFSKERNKWIAYCNKKYLGIFKTELEAFNRYLEFKNYEKEKANQK